MPALDPAARRLRYVPGEEDEYHLASYACGRVKTRPHRRRRSCRAAPPSLAQVVVKFADQLLPRIYTRSDRRGPRGSARRAPVGASPSACASCSDRAQSARPDAPGARATRLAGRLSTTATCCSATTKGRAWAFQRVGPGQADASVFDRLFTGRGLGRGAGVLEPRPPDLVALEDTSRVAYPLTLVARLYGTNIWPMPATSRPRGDATADRAAPVLQTLQRWCVATQQTEPPHHLARAAGYALNPGDAVLEDGGAWTTTWLQRLLAQPYSGHTACHRAARFSLGRLARPAPRSTVGDIRPQQPLPVSRRASDRPPGW